ncbi:uncharacterized mitochondrial protein AtMg00810-like [Rutidosis leptorrhynchoides]|uniref:uncharacterized mitochondrial protein AtMg00810-like n=1 Tax=Rutidosis leptorrhynchoides TaxID=125765 RepID=UPI003A9A1BD3
MKIDLGKISCLRVTSFVAYWLRLATSLTLWPCRLFLAEAKRLKSELRKVAFVLHHYLFICMLAGGGLSELDLAKRRIISSLHKEFAMTDLGPLNYFLGIHATRTASGMFLSQIQYATEIIERVGMPTSHPCRTPVEPGAKLTSHGPPVKDPTLYRSLAGALQYLTFTRLDISYAVQQICLFMHDSWEQHMHALKRIIHYIHGTTDHGLQLYASSLTTLVTYSDVDWAGCPTTRCYTSGYCVFLSNNLLSWSLKWKLMPSRSIFEADYRGFANPVAETCWIHNLLRVLHCPLTSTTLVYCDNASSVYLSSNQVQHHQTKHIEIDIQFVCDLIAQGQVRVLHMPSRYQFADIFTKGHPLSPLVSIYG